MKQRYPIIVNIGLALGLVVTSAYAIWAHNSLRAAHYQRQELAIIVSKNINEKIRDYVCESIDGINCYRVMREFHSKGMRAAMEYRTATLRLQIER